MTVERYRHHRFAAPRAGAVTAVFALLLQALVFAWHAHPLAFSQAGQPSGLSAPSPASPLAPAATEDDCSICLTLQHFSSAPAVFVELPAQAAAAGMPPRLDPAIITGEPTTGFHARAPPCG